MAPAITVEAYKESPLSHVVSIKLILEDLVALAMACDALGLVFKENQSEFRWYGRWVRDYHAADAAYRLGIAPKDYGKCKHAISVANAPSAYEIGLVPNPDGPGFVPVWDFYAGGYGLSEKIDSAKGKNDAGKLMQEYARQVVMRQVRESAGSLRVAQESFLADGSIVMEIESPIYETESVYCP